MSSSKHRAQDSTDLRASVRQAFLLHKLANRGDVVVVGVSGGADSLAMLHVLISLRDDLDIRLHIAHLNHQLRGADSGADATFVTDLAREWKIPATVQARDIRATGCNQSSSIEELARRARYAFLAQVARDVGSTAIAVAHNRDDQVETILMHFLRGAGLAGLRGMHYRSGLAGSSFGLNASQTGQTPIHLIRPMLDVSRTTIEKYCADNNLEPRIDRSNFDTTMFRNRLRHEVLPYLATLNPNLRELIIHSSLSIGDDYDFISAAIRNEYARLAIRKDNAIIFHRDEWSALHPAVQRGTLRLAVESLRTDQRNLSFVHIEDARRVALEKGAGAQATLPAGLVLSAGYSDFVIADAGSSLPLPDVPLLNVKTLNIPAQGQVELPDSNWVVETELTNHEPTAQGRWTAVFDYARCQGERSLRCRRPGDRFEPLGMAGHTRSLHEFMIDKKIDRATRARWPLLTADGRIIWVCGLRMDAHACPTEQTREFWCVTLRDKSS